MFTDAVDIVVSSSLLIKNSLGIIGVIIIFFIAAALFCGYGFGSNLQTGRSTHSTSL